jgi:hypothetical protein
VREALRLYRENREPSHPRPDSIVKDAFEMRRDACLI